MSDHYEEQIISLIFSLGRFIREHSGVEKGDAPSFIHLEIMKQLADSKGMTMTDLAEYLCIKAPSVTYLVEDLVVSKYAKRSHGTQDRRVVKIILTSKGKIALKKLYFHRADAFRKVLHQLGQNEQKTFIKTLEHIHEIYKQKINIKK